MTTRKIGGSRKVPKCWRRETQNSFINKSKTTQVRIRERDTKNKTYYQMDVRGLVSGDSRGIGCKNKKDCEKKAFDYMKKINQC